MGAGKSLVITGMMADFPPPGDAPEFRGRISIRVPRGGLPDSILPGCLSEILDEDGKLLPSAGVAIHIPAAGLITADVAVYLDKQGNILRDPHAIWRDSDGVPATFTYLVSEIRVS